MAEPTVEEVDAFLAEWKTLDGFLQPWHQARGLNWSTRWGILNALGAQEAELVFEINASLTRPTIVATFRKRLVYRVDIVPQSEGKPNPYGAMRLGLPVTVCGPHAHPWAANRKYVLDNGFGELPYREPRQIDDTLFIRALEVASADLNIHISSAQRIGCEPPSQAELFSNGTAE